ncbi:MAG: hypothetical protein IT377_22395 [Polyangiaceae bacterium]|nr:hypothetical protein [Polyangiaceae bacterium]
MNSSPTRSRRSVVLLACVLLAAVLACKSKKGPSPATVARAAELKPKVTQVLAQVASLSAKVKSGSAAAAAAPGQKLTWGTVTVTGENHLEDPKNTSTDVLDLGDPVLSVCKYIVDGRQIADDDIKSLEACARYEYAAVIRQSSYTPPDASGGSTYTPGTFSGSVLVFHLATQELRDQHSLSVSQSDQLELTSKKGEKPAEHEWRKQATAYLQRHVRAAAEKTIEYLPTVIDGGR